MRIPSIKNKVFKRASLYIATISLITFVILLGYNYYVSKRIILDNIRDNTRALAISTLSQINTIFVSAEKMPENISYILQCIDLNETEIKDLLRTLIENNKNIYGSAIAFEPYKLNKNLKYFCPYYYESENKLLYANLGTPEYDYLNQNWYSQAKKLNKALWSEPYFDKDGGNVVMVTYSQPFYKTINGERKFCGVVTCDISLSWLEDIISKIKIFETGYAFILSPEGKFIAHPNSTYYLNHQSFFTLADKFYDKKERELGEKMLQGKTGYERYYSHNEKRYCYLYYQPLALTGCTLGIVIPEDELLFKLRALTLTLFLIGAIGNLPSLILKIASKKIVSPIKSMLKNITAKKPPDKS